MPREVFIIVGKYTTIILHALNNQYCIGLKNPESDFYTALPEIICQTL